MKKITDTFTLHNGYEIPCIGFGTWQIPKGEAAEKAVISAIQRGYRHIDTAAAYGNEKSVGKGMKKSGVKRDELFVTSKVRTIHRGYDSTLKAFDQTMADLDLDYLDLYLIHWPAARGKKEEWIRENHKTWKALEELYQAGRIKAIGVSNFMPHHLEPLMQEAKVQPMVNQIEFHPGQMTKETLRFCKAHNILIEGWSPLGSGKMLERSELKEFAEKYDKSSAQICIRWSLQNHVLPLPKSATPERIAENADVFDFAISEEDMKKINSLPYMGGSGLHPDKVDF